MRENERIVYHLVTRTKMSLGQDRSFILINISTIRSTAFSLNENSETIKEKTGLIDGRIEVVEIVDGYTYS